MLNFNSVLVFSENAEKLSKYYSKVFQKDPEMEYEGYFGFLVGSCFITFGPHDKVKGKSKNPERIMFNFETRNVKEEFERVKSIKGSIVVAKPYEMGGSWIATIADPDGNYFQFVTPWEDMEAKDLKN